MQLPTIKDIQAKQQELADMLSCFASAAGGARTINALGREINLAEGEIYIGAIVNTDGTGHHTIILPGDVEKNWGDALDWAKSIGGDLPNRIEQAMLYANHAERFEKRAYWSNQKHEADYGFAWFQGFYDGSQYYGSQDDELRAVAVRRLPI
ncbi:DUF1566 domain-containing protein [Pandoraea anhela]|uniref:DUF1566 domain-containing protein n=1 Tax=Pandoraea anhela TaxID=2508295 RepID=A0A5E4S5C2_9BURK|nr:DUF1566 domain-containing protein [Pandoraea anhela]VVD70837.1 hypothetical protein PAN31108_00618 [Pandoraea anhela]